MSLRYLIACVLCMSLLSSCKTKSTNVDVDPAVKTNIELDVKILAADDMEGRETGTPGEMKAAQYIITRMKAIGLSPKGDSTSYLQHYTKQIKSNPHDDMPSEDDPVINGYNVIGYIDHFAQKTIVLGAHYDHLGYGGAGSLHSGKKAIHNGADDNASGVAAILRMAEELKDDSYSNHNYMFIAFSGEEKGLWGSNYFAKNPTIPKDKINMMVNLDMVGRLNKDRQIAIHGVGTSPSFNSTLDKENTYKFKVTKQLSGIGPSDHTSFYLEDIPVLHFFTGQHEHYHKPEDDSHLVNYDGIVDISEYIINIIESIDTPLEFTKTKDESSETPDFKVTLGVIPDYLFSGKGMRIDGVRDGRPADNAGLLKGDVVKQMGNREIIDMMSYMKALGAFEPGSTVEVAVERGERVIKKVVTF